jgi:hypothetical protein
VKNPRVDAVKAQVAAGTGVHCGGEHELSRMERVMAACGGESKKEQGEAANKVEPYVSG